ncbi:unnamed protein product [Symbiodinium microadriaticum]|nr:unnamed protein product [Symbiodinium microadriaticum]
MHLAVNTTDEGTRLQRSREAGAESGKFHACAYLHSLGTASAPGTFTQAMDVHDKLQLLGTNLRGDTRRYLELYVMFRTISRAMSELRTHLRPGQGRLVEVVSVTGTWRAVAGAHAVIWKHVTIAARGTWLLFDHPLLLAFGDLAWRRAIMEFTAPIPHFLAPLCYPSIAAVRAIWAAYEGLAIHFGPRVAFVTKEHRKIGLGRYLKERGTLARTQDYERLIETHVKELIVDKNLCTPDVADRFWDDIQQALQLAGTNHLHVAELSGLDKGMLQATLHLEDTIKKLRFDTGVPPPRTERQQTLTKAISGAVMMRIQTMYLRANKRWLGAQNTAELHPTLQCLFDSHIHDINEEAPTYDFPAPWLWADVIPDALESSKKLIEISNRESEPNPLIRLFLCESDINARIARFCDTLFIICEINETQINPSESFWDLTIWVLGKTLTIATNDTFSTPAAVCMASEAAAVGSASMSYDGIILAVLGNAVEYTALVEQLHYDIVPHGSLSMLVRVQLAYQCLQTSLELLRGPSMPAKDARNGGEFPLHHYSAQVLVSPDEFKNPSSFLRVYGDPLASSARRGFHGPQVLQDGNWRCENCSNINFPRRQRCNKCQCLRGASGDAAVLQYAHRVYEMLLKGRTCG